jgi:hypothetical protein
MRAGAAELGNNLRRRGCGEYEEEESVEYHEKRERERENEQEEHIILQTMLRPPPATAARAVPRVVLLVVSLSVEDEHLESRVSEMMGNL